MGQLFSVQPSSPLRVDRHRNNHNDGDDEEDYRNCSKAKDLTVQWTIFLVTRRLSIITLRFSTSIGKALAAKNDNVRAEPYSKKKPTKRDSSGADKENIDAKCKKQPKLSKAAAEIQEQYDDFCDIKLEKVLGEVPCYDDASTVRRKLNKLLTDKGNIPGTKKKWSQASMATVMQELEKKDGAVKYNKNSYGPSARTLATFLKRSGKMGGGDSPSYYWGYVLCEKLRMWDGGKKTKTREENETYFVGGLEREDPDHMWFWAHEDEGPPVWQPTGRQARHNSRERFLNEIRSERE